MGFPIHYSSFKFEEFGKSKFYCGPGLGVGYVMRQYRLHNKVPEGLRILKRR